MKAGVWRIGFSEGPTEVYSVIVAGAVADLPAVLDVARATVPYYYLMISAVYLPKVLVAELRSEPAASGAVLVCNGSVHVVRGHLYARATSPRDARCLCGCESYEDLIRSPSRTFILGDYMVFEPSVESLPKKDEP